jgi:choline transport protein
MALIALYKTDLVIQPWMTFVVYQGFNVLTASTVMFGNRFLPLINKFSCALLALPPIRLCLLVWC